MIVVTDDYLLYSVTTFHEIWKSYFYKLSIKITHVPVKIVSWDYKKAKILTNIAYVTEYVEHILVFSQLDDAI